jgi:hypothetical protein
LFANRHRHDFYRLRLVQAFDSPAALATGGLVSGRIVLAGFLLFCAGVVAIFGFAAAEGAPHAFAGDVRIGIVCWLMALAMTVIAISWFIRSSRRLRSLRELRLHQSEFRSVLEKR